VQSVRVFDRSLAFKGEGALSIAYKVHHYQCFILEAYGQVSSDIWHQTLPGGIEMLAASCCLLFFYVDSPTAVPDGAGMHGTQMPKAACFTLGSAT
jgi:hypothetical protein